MKTAYSKETTNKRDKPKNSRSTKTKYDDNNHQPDATISLLDNVTFDGTTAKYMSVKRTLPVTAGSMDHVYEKYIIRFNEGTPKRWLSFLKEFEEVKTQLELTNGALLYNNFKTFLTRDALEKWNAVAEANGTQTVDHFNKCIKDMMTYCTMTVALTVRNENTFSKNCDSKRGTQGSSFDDPSFITIHTYFYACSLTRRKLSVRV